MKEEEMDKTNPRFSNEEVDEIEDICEANEIGTIFHQCMYNLFADHDPSLVLAVVEFYMRRFEPPSAKVVNKVESGKVETSDYNWMRQRGKDII